MPRGRSHKPLTDEQKAMEKHMLKKKISKANLQRDVRNRYEHFKHVTVTPTVMDTFATYVKDKMTSH